MSSVKAAATSPTLPTPLTSLIGRERELAELSTLLQDPASRLINLTGAGGTGKTRLAIAATAQVADTFPDGVAFVSLASIREPELVVTAIALALGVRESGDRSLKASLTAYLQTKYLLLVLDNFEHLPDAAPLVGELLASCPHLTTLVTSRSVLHLYGELDYEVAPLALPDTGHLPPLAQLRDVEAIRLFVERAQASRSSFQLTSDNAPAIAAICTRLDGLPLAIELAAARIRILSPQALLARLEHRLKLLTGGPQDVPERQQTMRNTIAWSYDLLSADQQTLLRQLAVFNGGWTLEAAEAVNENGSDVIDTIAALVDQSLIRQLEWPGDTTRFGMLETIREFALDRLEASDESQTARRRHAGYCLDFVERHAAGMLTRVTEQTAIVQILGDEHDNLRAALDWLLQHDPNAALRLAGNLWPFWAMRGLLSEGVRWVSAALERAQTAPAIDRSRALVGLGNMASDLGDFALAQQALNESLPLSEESGDRFSVAWVLRRLGVIAGWSGDIDTASEYYSASLAIARDLNESWLLVPVLGNLAGVAHARGDLGLAATMLEESIAIARAEKNAFALSSQLHNLAAINVEQGNIIRARALCKESLAIAVEIASPFLLTGVLDILGDVEAADGAPDRATQLYAAAEAGMIMTGDVVKLTMPDRLQRLAELQHLLGESEWERIRAAGLAMSLDEAATFVLNAGTSSEPVTPRDASTGLTPREIDVLRLIADSKADKEIADILSISPFTVMRHVQNILAKLDLPSRTAAATWAMRNGIV